MFACFRTPSVKCGHYTEHYLEAEITTPSGGCTCLVVSQDERHDLNLSRSRFKADGEVKPDRLSIHFRLIEMLF